LKEQAEGTVMGLSRRKDGRATMVAAAERDTVTTGAVTEGVPVCSDVVADGSFMEASVSTGGATAKGFVSSLDGVNGSFVSAVSDVDVPRSTESVFAMARNDSVCRMHRSDIMKMK